MMRPSFPINDLRRTFVGSVLLITAVAAMEFQTARTQLRAQQPGKISEQKTAFVTDRPLAVAFSPRNTAVATAGFGGELKIWGPPNCELLQTIPGPNLSTRRALTFSPDGDAVAVGGDDRTVRIYEVHTGKLKQTFADHIGNVFSIVISPDSKTLASAAIKHEMKDRVATGKFASEICLWDMESGKRKQTWNADQAYILSLAFSPNGKTLAYADGKVRIRDVMSGEMKQTLVPERGSVTTVAFSPDGKEIAGGGGYAVQAAAGTRGEGELGIWDLGTGKPRLTKTGLPSAPNCIAYSPDGKVLAEGSQGPIRREPRMSWVSSELRWWDARTGDLLQTVEGKLGGVSSLAFSPDGEVILWCDDREVVVTATATGVRRATVMKVTERIMKEKD